MICWSCQKEAGDEMLCPGCKALQPPSPQADYFQVFGIRRRFDLDLDDLERRYKDTTKLLHPDRFARADPRARRASLERSVQLNQGWRTLRDPIRRGEYLLSLDGITIGEPGGASLPAGQRTTVRVPQALLMEILELRESLAEAQSAKDTAKIRALTAEVRARVDGIMVEVAKGFAEVPPTLHTIAGNLVSVRYYQRFMDEAQVALEQQSPTGGAPHAS